MIFGIIALIVVVLIIIYVISTYNSLVGLRNKVSDQSSQIDVELKRRFDLVPNLVETVKGYAKHEKETFADITNARTSFDNAKGNVKDELAANAELTTAITKLFAVVENYPELKSNTNFLSLQNELSSIEEQIVYKREFYNETVRKYIDKIQMFPSNIVAGMFHFEKTEYFQIEAAERENVQVKF